MLSHHTESAWKSKLHCILSILPPGRLTEDVLTGLTLLDKNVHYDFQHLQLSKIEMGKKTGLMLSLAVLSVLTAAYLANNATEVWKGGSSTKAFIYGKTNYVKVL